MYTAVYGLAVQGDISGRTSCCCGKVYALHRHLLHTVILTYLGAEVLKYQQVGRAAGAPEVVALLP